MRIRPGLLAVFLATPLVGLPGVAQAETVYTVDSTADRVDAAPGDGVCRDAVGACTLRAAVMEANSDAEADVIVLPLGRFVLTMPPAPWDNGDPITGTDPATGDLNISEPVTIRGAGTQDTVIDGNLQSRILSNGATLTVADLTLTRGKVPPPRFGPSGGGAIWNSATLTLTRVAIVANTAEYGAGVFNSPGSYLSIRDSLVADNTGNEAGGIRFDSGGLVVNTTITRNRVELRPDRLGESSGYGGGIDSRGAGGTLDIIGSVITDNYASEGGGGLNVSQGYFPVYPVPGQTVVRLKDTTVTGNRSAAGPSDCRTAAGVLQGQGGNTDSDGSCPD